MPFALRPDFSDGTGLEAASGFNGAPKGIQSFESRFPLRRGLRDLSQGALEEIVDLLGDGVLPLAGQTRHGFILIIVQE